MTTAELDAIAADDIEFLRLVAGQWQELRLGDHQFAEFQRIITQYAALVAEVRRLQEEIAGWVRYRQDIDEALNSGDGSYRP